MFLKAMIEDNGRHRMVGDNKPRYVERNIQCERLFRDKKARFIL